MNAVIDAFASYAGSLAAVAAAAQRLKDQLMARGHEDESQSGWEEVLSRLTHTYNLSSTPGHSDPTTIGTPTELDDDDLEKTIVCAASSYAAYRWTAEDEYTWTAYIDQLIRECYPSPDPIWIDSGELIPQTILLNDGAHYMRHSKPALHLALHHRLDAVIMSMRGTAVLADWASNLHSAPVMLNLPAVGRAGTRTVQVHGGFYRIAVAIHTHPAVRSYVSKALLSLESSEQRPKILLTGHSQAGAVMSLLAVLYAQDYPQTDVEAIGFGSGACISDPSVLKSSRQPSRSKHRVSRTPAITTIVRCVRHRASSRSQDWLVDPVPMIDDSLASLPSWLHGGSHHSVSTNDTSSSAGHRRSATSGPVSMLVPGRVLIALDDRHTHLSILRDLSASAPHKPAIERAGGDTLKRMLGGRALADPGRGASIAHSMRGYLLTVLRLHVTWRNRAHGHVVGNGQVSLNRPQNDDDPDIDASATDSSDDEIDDFIDNTSHQPAQNNPSARYNLRSRTQHQEV
ncbi:hypothetical protein PYCC9005_000925 [Savitreella phatthalungensis]